MAKTGIKKTTRKSVAGPVSLPTELDAGRSRQESRTDAIIAAAYCLFQEKGYARTTTAEIARLSNVSEGTIFNHFSNKDALASAVIEKFYQRLTDEAREGTGRLNSTRERLTFLATHHLINILESQRILQMALLFDFTLEMKADNPLYRMNRKYVSVFDQVIRDAMWRGDLPDSSSTWIMRDTFYGALEYAMRTMLLRGQQTALETFSTGLVDLMLGQGKANGRVMPTGSELIQLAESLEKTVDRFEAMSAAKQTE